MRVSIVLVLILALCGATGCGGETDVRVSSGPARPAADSTATHDPLVRYTYEQRRGLRIYDRYCSVCHGTSGEGDGFNAFNLDPRPHDLTDREYLGAISDASLAEIIAQGGRGVNKSVLMPAYGGTLTSRQIEDLVAYLRTLTGASPGAEE